MQRLTHALPNSFSAIIRVLSNMSVPGPEAIHISFRPEQVLLCTSQGRPLNWHRAPLTLGDTSPKLVDAKAATKGPCKMWHVYIWQLLHDQLSLWRYSWSSALKQVLTKYLHGIGSSFTCWPSHHQDILVWYETAISSPSSQSSWLNICVLGTTLWRRMGSGHKFQPIVTF
jgi:hypothetical protein